MSPEEEMLLDTFAIEGKTYWLGLTDKAQEGTRLNISLFEIICDFVNFAGTYVWEESHQVADYTPWAKPNEPDDDGTKNLDCVWKHVSGWHDAGCWLSSWKGGREPVHALCQATKE